MNTGTEITNSLDKKEKIMEINRIVDSITFKDINNNLEITSKAIKRFDDYGEYIEIVLADHIDINRGFICDIICDFEIVDNVDRYFKKSYTQEYKDMLLVNSRFCYSADDITERTLIFYK